MFDFKNKIKKPQFSKFLFCIMYIFHNSYFVFFVFSVILVILYILYILHILHIPLVVSSPAMLLSMTPLQYDSIESSDSMMQLNHWIESWACRWLTGLVDGCPWAPCRDWNGDNDANIETHVLNYKCLNIILNHKGTYTCKGT